MSTPLIRKRVGPVAGPCGECPAGIRERTANNPVCIHRVPWDGEIYCIRNDRLVCTDKSIREGKVTDMAKLKTNFDQVPDQQQWRVLEQGVYIFEVTSVDDSNFTNEGEPLIHAELTFTHKVNTSTKKAEPLVGTPATLRKRISDEPKIAGLVKKFLVGINVSGQNVDSADWKGRRGIADVAPGSYTSKSTGNPIACNQDKNIYPYEKYLEILSANGGALPTAPQAAPAQAAAVTTATPVAASAKKLW